MPIRVLLVSLLLLAALTAAAQDDAGRDALLSPLPVRDQFLLGNGFFFFEPGGARVLDRGAWAADLHTADANTFSKSAWISRSLEGQNARQRALDTLDQMRFASQDTLFLIDGQTHRATLGIRAGVAPHLEVGVAIPVSTVGGGWSDGIIESVHRALRVGNGQREAFSQNSETVLVRSSTTNYLRNRNAGAKLGDVALTAKYELSWLEEKTLSLSVQGAAELPTGNSQTLDGSGSLDGGLQVLVTRDFGRSQLHGSLGIIRLGANRALGTKAQFLITDTVAATRLLTDRTSATLQLTVSESPFRNIGIHEFHRRSYQLTAGFQHALRGDFVVYTGVIENLLTYENSADAGMVWGVSRRF
jgi:hypothetical protein